MVNDSGFTPNGDLVLILPLEVQEMTPGGIALPGTTREKEGRAARLGHVVAIGDDARNHPRMKGVEVGSMVLFPRYAGDELPTNGKTYLIMYDKSILGPMTKIPTYHIAAAISGREAFGANEQAA